VRFLGDESCPRGQAASRPRAALARHTAAPRRGCGRAAHHRSERLLKLAAANSSVTVMADASASAASAPAQSAPPHHHTGERLGDYILGRTLGVGSFAKVKLATHVFSKARVAIKIIYKAQISDDYVRRNLTREASLLQRIQHPHVAQLFEVIDDEHCYCLIVELADGGEILDYIITHEQLHERETRKFMAQIAHALAYMHRIGICHRDLKAENLLLDSNMDIKIIDFGLGNFCDRSSTLSTRCGSLSYTSPEVLVGRKYSGPEVDAWSAGVNLYVMLTGRLPFKGENVTLLHAHMMEGRYHIPDTLSTDARELIRRSLEVDPIKRITVEQVCLIRGSCAPLLRLIRLWCRCLSTRGSVHPECQSCPC
jgi:serine/threonine protein kinase